MEPHNHPSLIRRTLIDAMKTGQYANCRQLPSEHELSEKLNVSRTMLRDVLAALEREGLILRRHGIGTIINRHVLDLSCRMDIETEFLEMIEQSGFTPSVSFVRVSTRQASEKTAQMLGIPADSPVLHVERVCTADGKPAIYCDDILPTGIIKKKYTVEDLHAPIFSFLRQFCGIESYMDVTTVRPVIADDTLAQLLQLSPGVPLLNMEELNLDRSGTPIFLSRQYFVDGIIQHTVVRKKL